MKTYAGGTVAALTSDGNAGTPSGTLTSASDSITLGVYKWNPSSSPFQGSLDEFRVYADRALTAADISSSFNTQVTVDSFLVLSLTFDDTSDLKLDSSCGGSSDATSSTAASTTGKLCGAASATATVCPVLVVLVLLDKIGFCSHSSIFVPALFLTFRCGGAYFSGASDGSSKIVTAPVDLSGKSFTIMVWVNKQSDTGEQKLITHGAAQGARTCLQLYFETSGRFIGSERARP
jgi:hypothetical protein